MQLLVGGFQIPNLDMPAVVSGPALTDAGAALQSAGGSMVYFPSMLEFGVVLERFRAGRAHVAAGPQVPPVGSRLGVRTRYDPFSAEAPEPSGARRCDMEGGGAGC